MKTLSFAFKNLSLLLLTTFSAQMGLSSPIDFPGLIPKTSDKQQASDVVYKDRVLLPDELTALAAQGQDISLLNPNANTDLWHNQMPKPLDLAGYSLGLKESGEYRFLADLVSRVGNFRFTISVVDEKGVNRNYVVLVSKTMHNVLLRKAFLEKLGYVVPSMQYMPKMKIRFNGAFSRKDFISQIRNNTFGDPERWVLDLNNTESDTISLQDVLVLSADDHIYNLALGATTSSVVQGRRILNAVQVPYSLLDAPESINIFSWTSGQVISEGIYLPFEGAEEFNPSYEDARWIARRIANLTRNDFTEVVNAAKLPQEVSALLVEKLLSRRNSLLSLFNFKFPDINVDSKISAGSLLVDGKLTQQIWPNYASRFSFGDPISPVSPTEVKAFFKSKFYSSLIENLVFQFNNMVLPHTNIAQEVYNHQLDKTIGQIEELINTGTVHKIPFGMYTIPSFAGHLIASREIVVGSYLGTDNLVQIADSFGFQVSAGFYLGFDGIQNPALFPSGQAGASFTRTYTHIKPIKSMAAALKEPYKNMMVPLFKKDLGKIFDPLLSMNAKASDEDQQKLLTDTVGLLTKSMATGDSLIITDSLNATAGLSIGYTLATAVAAQARISDTEVIIHRLQIFKKDDSTIQVYRDPGDVNTFGISLGIGTHGIQILNLGFSRASGHEQTDFFKINIDSDKKRNPDVVTNLLSVRQLLLENSLEMVESKQKPFQIAHEFNEKSTDFGFLFFKSKSLRTSDKITATSPEGVKKSFLYRALATRKGKDYQSLALEALQSFIQSQAGRTDLYLDNTGSGNPGDSFYGNAISRRVSFESELVNEQANSPLGETYANISQNHKGWNITKVEALKIIGDFNQQFGVQLFWPADLNDAKKIQLYVIDLEMNIYQSGIDFITHISPENVRSLFLQYAKFPKTPVTTQGRSTGVTPAQTRAFHDSIIKKFIQLQNDFLAKSVDGRNQEAAEDGANLISTAELLFPGKDLINLVGGPDNIFIQARISGFRDKDERGETPLVSTTIGVVGSRKVNGPLRFVQTNLEMSESEFFLYWLLSRI